MRLSVQLYTLREPIGRDLVSTLQGVRDLGIEFVEMAGLHGRSAEEWRNLLDDLGLKVCGSHVGLGALEGAFEALIDENKILGNRYVIVPWVDMKAFPDGYRELAGVLEGHGQRLREAGLTLAYHNHAFELQQEEDGRPGLEVLFEHASPESVRAEIDVGWVRHAGHDPARFIRDLGRRCPLVHLKDFTDNPAALDIEAGSGIVDWDSVLEACEEAGVEFGVIELDHPPRPALESVRISREFFVSRGLN
jgi:sugar phosphate isomerase/epimerase